MNAAFSCEQERWNYNAHASLRALNERIRVQWRRVRNMERTADEAGHDPWHSTMYLAEYSVLTMLLSIRRAGRLPARRPVAW